MKRKNSVAIELAKECWAVHAEVVTVIRAERVDGTYFWCLQYGGIDSLLSHRDIEALEIEGPWHNASAMARDIYGAMREIENTVR